MSNPQALRVEYRLDDSRLELWWSPLAGRSTDCADRNFSSRDAHLDVFAEITLPGCGLGGFLRCDYDPYHCVLHFEKQTLHLALRTDIAAVFVWCDQPQSVNFKTHRYDERLAATPRALAVAHAEPGRNFEFAAALAPQSSGLFRHGPIHTPDFPRYSCAELAAGQLLVLGAGLAGEDIARRITAAAAIPPADHLAAADAILAPHEAAGHIVAPAHPELSALRRKVVRGLHSMIDESGAYRASLKAIYYLIWVRDSGFSFAYQAASGWPHKLPELCRLLLDNPTTVQDPGLPNTRMFAQLVNRNLGKLEEDGLYYVVWSLFTHWTQFGRLDFASAADWALIDEALAWIEAVTWDESRGLYGSHWADETPGFGHRDQGWDYAIGQPAGSGEGIRHQGRPVSRNYDVYHNLCMHSIYCMLAALRNEPAFLNKAARVWPELQKLLNTRNDGVPVYGEVLMADTGERLLSPHWGSASSCCVWGLTMPNLAPLADWDAVWAATLDAIIAKPDMHFINGICSAMAAVDPWYYNEKKLLALHQRLATETNTPGKYLPMGGAMPEKFGAPQGNLYHDIRPQGFAMGSWLAAWSSLGLRRLPHGLALRPTAAFERIENYLWRGHELTFQYGATGRNLALEINGERIEGTLQLPQNSINQDSTIQLVSSSPAPLWLRSSVQLDRVTENGSRRCYHFQAYGLSQITFSAPPDEALLGNPTGAPVAGRWTSTVGLHTLHFTYFGALVLQITASSSGYTTRSQNKRQPRTTT
jgi:hypothetical protein